MAAEPFFLNIKKIHIAHRYTLDQNHKCAYPRGRGTYGLVYALQGSAEFRMAGGERAKVSQGDLLFLTPNVAYTVVPKVEFEHYTVNFELNGEDSFFGLLAEPYCLLRQESAEAMERCFRRMVRFWLEQNAMQATACLYELLAAFYFSYTAGRQSASYRRLQTARGYIERHFREPFTLEELAQVSAMSVGHFRREWKRLYGDSPLQYRDSIRLYYAKEYLQSGYCTVAEAAEQCGFSDVSYFVRFYKKKTGTTPGTLKKVL